MFPSCKCKFPPYVAAAGCCVSFPFLYVLFCWIVLLRAKLKVPLYPHSEELSWNIKYSHMSMQLFEPVFFLLPILVSFPLEELFHFRLRHFLGLLRFPLSTDLRHAWLRCVSASRWVEGYYIPHYVPHSGWVAPTGDSAMRPLCQSRQCPGVGLTPRDALTWCALFIATCEEAPFHNMIWYDERLLRSVRAPLQTSFIIKTHLASCLSHWLAWSGWRDDTYSQ